MNTEVQKVECDVEAILKQIEDFFEHLFHHTHADNHPALETAKTAVQNAVTMTHATITPAPTPESAPAAETGAA